MTVLVAAQIQRLLPRGTGAHLLAGEVPAAQGIADIVAVRFRPDAVRHRLQTGIGPICSPLRIRTLALLRSDRGMRASTLARKLGSNAQALMRSTLGPLEEMGAVRLDGGIVFSTGAWCPVAAHITAVELKLSKWRDALWQADNFAFSADAAWVVLDHSKASAGIDAVERFHEVGIGLAVVDVDGRMQVINRPRGRRPEPWLRALISERAWAAAEDELAVLAAPTQSRASGRESRR